MSISPEMLAAYADDQLDGADRAMVEQALAQDPALAQEVATHRALRARLAPISRRSSRDAARKPDARAQGPACAANGNRCFYRDRPRAPPRTRGTLPEPGAREQGVPARPRWAVGAGIALAACVALAVVIGRPAMVPASNYAAPELAQALDSRLSGEQGAAARKSCSALPMQRARSAVVLPEARPRALPATMPMAGASNAGSPA
jgi:anti-sigma factor RsiW